MKKPPNKNIKEEEHWSWETANFKSEKLETDIWNGIKRKKADKLKRSQ